MQGKEIEILFFFIIILKVLWLILLNLHQLILDNIIVYNKYLKTIFRLR